MVVCGKSEADHFLAWREHTFACFRAMTSIRSGTIVDFILTCLRIGRDEFSPSSSVPGYIEPSWPRETVVE
jgi:hypothetical protein